MILPFHTKKNDVRPMDITLAKTFLAITETGSFVSAAARLNVTQTAVSARVRALEEQLGRRLFVRNKSGARLTPAGERFVKHAISLIQVWDRARHQIGLPEGRVDIASVGAELSLWNPVLIDWLVWMGREAPEMAVRAEVDSSTNLIEAVRGGTLDMAIIYDPPHSAGLVVELLEEERLMMVTTQPDGSRGSAASYVHVDWGPAVQVSSLAQTTTPGVSISHGPLALLYILRSGGTGYFRHGAVQSLLAEGKLHRVVDAPEFGYSAHLVYSSQAEPALIEKLRLAFRRSANVH
jgi:DNA-binding transcriptional LysR family regulator